MKPVATKIRKLSGGIGFRGSCGKDETHAQRDHAKVLEQFEDPGFRTALDHVPYIHWRVSLFH
jgi:hypothetical protein